MNKKRLGPPPDWIANSNETPETEATETKDPLTGIFAASRTVRLGEQEDDALLDAYREAQERVTEAQVLAEIKTLLTVERKRSEPFTEIQLAPMATSDVRDVRGTRLIVLPSNHLHTVGGVPSVALKKAQAFLTNYGAGPRRYRNALVFIAPDATKMQELTGDLRAMLAWGALVDSPATSRLEPRYAARAKAQLQRYQERRETALREAYSWALVPTQSHPEAPVEWRGLPLLGNGTLAERAALALIEAGVLRIDEIGLADDIGRARTWLGDTINSAGQLAEEFARYLYLPRLTDERILLNVLHTVLSASIQPRSRTSAMKRPFTAALRLDPNDLTQTGLAPELLAQLLSVVGPGDIKLTLQIDALVPEHARAQLENLIAELRNRGTL